MEGHVSSLKRTRVGEFCIADAISLDELRDMEEPDDRRAVLMPIETALDDVPKIEIEPSHSGRLMNGNDILLLPHQISRWKEDRAALLGEESDDRLVVVTTNGKAVAMGEVRAGHFQPVRVFQY